MLELETKYFESKLPQLIQSDMGKVVLIKDEQIIGMFAAMADALKAGYEKFKEEPFFVKQILPVQEPLNFANNYLFS